MNSEKKPPVTVDAGTAPTVSMVGDTYQILLSGKQTGGAFAMMDFLIPPGGGPGPHAHAQMTETFYVIDGEIEVRSEAGSYRATKGAVVNIPKGGIVHQFKNTSGSIAHVLCMVSPAGLDEFFLEAGRPVLPGTFLPPPEMDEKLREKMGALAKKYGQELFPPDYLER